MAMTPEERLDELEHDPYEHDRLDIERMLAATGFRRISKPELRTDVWVHDAWSLSFTLDTTVRRVPVPYLLYIIEEVRTNLKRESNR